MKKHSKNSSKKKRKKQLKFLLGFVFLSIGILFLLFNIQQKEKFISLKLENLLKKINVQFEKIVDEEKVKIYHIFTAPLKQKNIKEEILSFLKKDLVEIKKIEEKEEDTKTIEILFLKTKKENLILYFFSQREKEIPKIIEKKRVNIIIVMDDLGQSLEPLHWFSNENLPIALSFIPNLPFTKKISEELHKEGYEILIHIPMEPLNYPKTNPGNNAILLSMESKLIEEKIENFIKEIPFAIGVNNHMGSAYTSNLEKMLEFMQIIKKHNLFFLDSRTTPETKGREAANQIGLVYFERAIFLDNIVEENYIKRQFDFLLQKAKENNLGIAICHPHPQTFKILKKMLPILKKKAKFLKFKDVISNL